MDHVARTRNIEELAAAGFALEHEPDCLEVARRFLREEQAKVDPSAGPPPLGTHILLKEDAPRIFENVVRLFEQGVLAPTQFFCRAR